MATKRKEAPVQLPLLANSADLSVQEPVSLHEVRKHVKKHVGAIHINGKLTLLQRKIANVLLLNAYEELLIKEKHQIAVKTLAEVIGFDSNDHQLIKNALETLAKTIIKWNILDKDGVEEWGVSSMLAHAHIKYGICNYSYSIALREKLYNPEIYARINLDIQKRFASGYALTLYENCLRYRNVGITGWITLEMWRELLGIEANQYALFKDFNKRVLKPAIQEINETSDILLSTEYKREKRKVTALKFHIQDNPQNHFPLLEAAQLAEELEADASTEILWQRLLALGLSMQQAQQITTDYEESYLQANLTTLEQLFTKAPVTDQVTFVLTALKNNLAASEQLTASAKKRTNRPSPSQPPRLAQLKNEFEQQVFQQIFEQLSAEEQAILKADFVKELMAKEGAGYAVIRRFYQKQGFEHKAVNGMFKDFVRRRFPLPEADTAFAAFVRAQGYQLSELE